MLDFLSNLFTDRYKKNSEAVIISCYFNPQNNPYRLKAFRTFYSKIKHLNHVIYEVVINDSKPQLTEINKSDIFGTKIIKRIYTESSLWHKESTLNNIISTLPKKFKYVFWLDTDIIFTNNNWLVDGVNQLKKCNIIQPFEYCVHLRQDMLKPTFNMDLVRNNRPNTINTSVWKSFCSNYATDRNWRSTNYHIHGHVGFAWGAKRSVLDKCNLYDKALIGGADHIIAHAASGQLDSKCISKAFTDSYNDIKNWSLNFSSIINGKIGYVKGDLYHIWHGDVNKRQYLKRIVENDSIIYKINSKDKNGLFKSNDKFFKKYLSTREVISANTNNYYNDIEDDIVDDVIDLSIISDSINIDDGINNIINDEQTDIQFNQESEDDVSETFS